MDRKKLTQTLNVQASMIWDSLCEMHPKLAKFDCPEIVLNGRFWRTAGQCHQEENLIELGYKFFQDQQNYVTMFNVILPHEIIHQADYNLFGESELNCGHGENWQKLMREYGLQPAKHHEMDLK